MMKKILIAAAFLFLLTAFSGCTQQQQQATEPEQQPPEPQPPVEQPQQPPVEQPEEQPAEPPAEEQPVEPPVEALPEQPQPEFDFNNGLVFYIDFDSETKRQFLDVSGNNIHATKVNFFDQSTVVGVNNSKAASFSGRNDYLEIDNLSFRGRLESFTVSVWVNVKDLTEIRNIFSRLLGHSFYPDFSIIREGEVTFNSIINSNNPPTLSTKKGSVQSGKWQHIVLTFENGTKNAATIYIDGELNKATEFGAGKMNTGANTMWIGRSAAISFTNFAGAMDEFRLYNRALTEAEVKALYDKHAQLQAFGTSKYPTAFFSISQSVINFLTNFFR